MTQPQETIDALGLTVESEFVPFSQSRNFNPDAKWSGRSLNWWVTVKRNGRVVLTTDYSAGIAHCPSYKQNVRPTLDYVALIEFETENGYPAKPFDYHSGVVKRPGTKKIEPNPVDVLYSLAADANALDYATFEDWAQDFGYDTDSRSAEKVYRACLEITLRLRSDLGDLNMQSLRDAFQDY
jgi:hypothetical protein